jgi:REP element-mobilizing transposase RayT
MTPSPHTPRAGALRKGRFSESLGLYFLTKCTQDHHVLCDEQRADVVAAFLHFRETGDLLLHAFVVMPDHWHVLISLGTHLPLPELMRVINRHASFRSRQADISVPWQHAYHDHKLRSGESVVDMVQYIEANPVRKNLTAQAEAWPWSSAYPQWRDRLDRGFLGHERWG